MLPLLLISTVPAFTLLLVATKPATTARPCKLARDLGLLALLLARELFRHATTTPAGLSNPLGAPTSMKAKPPAALAAAPEPEPNEGLFPLLDLPELALDRVLEELSPAPLAAMSCVCAALRDRCSADALWGLHLRAKWARVLGPAARNEWEAHLAHGAGAARAANGPARPGRRRSWVDSLACAWPFSWIGCRWLRCDDTADAPEPAAPARDTAAAWYRALECGDFCFPAQVYNREVRSNADQLLYLPLNCTTTNKRRAPRLVGCCLAGRACRLRALLLRRAPPLRPPDQHLHRQVINFLLPVAVHCCDRFNTWSSTHMCIRICDRSRYVWGNGDGYSLMRLGMEIFFMQLLRS